MALGGVATGNMKASDALMVQGIMMYSGWMPMERDMEAKIGRNRVVVATLLVHSVVIATRQDKIKVMAAGLTELKGSICLAIHSDSPEASHPFAIANPPPRSSTMPQGTLSWVNFQSSSAGG